MNQSLADFVFSILVQQNSQPTSALGGVQGRDLGERLMNLVEYKVRRVACKAAALSSLALIADSIRIYNQSRCCGTDLNSLGSHVLGAARGVRTACEDSVGRKDLRPVKYSLLHLETQFCKSSALEYYARLSTPPWRVHGFFRDRTFRPWTNRTQNPSAKSRESRYSTRTASAGV